MRKILLISYHFPPSSEVGALRAGRLARLLPGFGYQVDVVCASLTRAVGHQDLSQIHRVPDPSRVRRVDTRWVLGRDPHKLPKAARPLQWAWWKARAYTEWLFFTHDWSWNWGQEAWRETASSVDVQEYDLLIVDAPPFPSVVPFVRWARGEGVPVLLDFRDLWAFENESVSSWWFLSPKLRRKVWRIRLRDEAVRAAAGVVLTSPETLDEMLNRFPDVGPHHFSLIPNAFESVDALPEAGSGSTEPNRLQMVYTGSLAYGRAKQVIRLLRGMEEFGRRGSGDAELVLAGKDSEGLVRAAKSQGLSSGVRSVGWIDRNEAIRLQQDAHALLLLQPVADLGTRVAIPAKLFEYMARRRPILGMVGHGSAGKVIIQHDLGVVVVDETPERIAEALIVLAERTRREPFLPLPPEEFSEASTVARFAEVIDSLLAGRSVT